MRVGAKDSHQGIGELVGSSLPAGRNGKLQSAFTALMVWGEQRDIGDWSNLIA